MIGKRVLGIEVEKTLKIVANMLQRSCALEH